MKPIRCLITVVSLTSLFLIGCQPEPEPSRPTAATTSQSTPPAATKPATPATPATPAAPAAPAATAAPAAPAAPATPAAAFKPVRIKAGVESPVKDAEGNTWLADQGFEGGDTVQRPDLQIANTQSPDIYRAERYSMTAFSHPVPNGKYVVKLHFCETFEGIMGPGERVFSFNVEGQEFKDFDVWVKTGGAQRAYIETVNVEVKDGKLDVTFTPKVENPEINGIEILPAP